MAIAGNAAHTQAELSKQPLRRAWPQQVAKVQAGHESAGQHAANCQSMAILAQYETSQQVSMGVCPLRSSCRKPVLTPASSRRPPQVEPLRPA